MAFGGVVVVSAVEDTANKLCFLALLRMETSGTLWKARIRDTVQRLQSASLGTKMSVLLNRPLKVSHSVSWQITALLQCMPRPK